MQGQKQDDWLEFDHVMNYSQLELSPALFTAMRSLLSALTLSIMLSQPSSSSSSSSGGGSSNSSTQPSSSNEDGLSPGSHHAQCDAGADSPDAERKSSDASGALKLSWKSHVTGIDVFVCTDLKGNVDRC